MQKVIIIGGGLGGLTLARALSQKGIKSTVYERDESSSSRPQGYLIGLNPKGIAVLRAIKLSGLEEFLRYNDAKGFTMINSNGKVLARLAPPGEMALVNRWILRDKLEEGVDIQWGKKFLKYEEKGDKVVAYFEDGTNVEGDILVGADGSKSLVRSQRCPSLKYDEIGVVTVAGFLPLLEENELPTFSKILKDSAIRLFAPLGLSYLMMKYRNEKGDPCLVWAASMPKFENPPVDLESWKSFLLEKATFHDEVKTVVERTPVENLLNIRELRSVVPVNGSPLGNTSRVTILGDAAHAMTTHAGLGGNTALEDSIDLSEALSSPNLFQALHEYEVKMFERGFRNATTSLRSTRMIHTNGWKASLRNGIISGIGWFLALRGR